jgi:hypothetical protein
MSHSAILADTNNQPRDFLGRFAKKHIYTESNPESYASHDYTQSPFTTRPSSSFSNFNVVDSNQTYTPFGSTPEVSPVKQATIPLPPAELPSPHDEMPTEQVDPFHGDKEDENPKDFLHSFFRRMGTAGDDVKKKQFKYFLQADSATDEWFKELQDGDKKDWDSIGNTFNKHWPSKKAAKKTKEEYEEEITGLKLKMEDLGKKEKTAGREIYSHIVWADKMATTVKGAKIEATTMYIGQVRKELPRSLREKVGAGHADWTAFLQAVWDVDINHIRDEADIWRKEEEEREGVKKRLQLLEKLTASPTTPLRQHMTSFSLGSPTSSPAQQPRHTTTVPANPFTGTSGGRGNLFQTPQTTNCYDFVELKPNPKQSFVQVFCSELQEVRLFVLVGLS